MAFSLTVTFALARENETNNEADAGSNQRGLAWIAANACFEIADLFLGLVPVPGNEVEITDMRKTPRKPLSSKGFVDLIPGTEQSCETFESTQILP